MVLFAPKMVSTVYADCYSTEIFAMARKKKKKNPLKVTVGQKGSECSFEFAGFALARSD